MTIRCLSCFQVSFVFCWLVQSIWKGQTRQGDSLFLLIDIRLWTKSCSWLDRFWYPSLIELFCKWHAVQSSLLVDRLRLPFLIIMQFVTSFTFFVVFGPIWRPDDGWTAWVFVTSGWRTGHVTPLNFARARGGGGGFGFPWKSQIRRANDASSFLVVLSFYLSFCLVALFLQTLTINRFSYTMMLIQFYLTPYYDDEIRCPSSPSTFFLLRLCQRPISAMHWVAMS